MVKKLDKKGGGNFQKYIFKLNWSFNLFEQTNLYILVD